MESLKYLLTLPFKKIVFKTIMFAAITVILPFVFIECLSFIILLSVNTAKESSFGVKEHLTQKFPAQFRMTKEEIQKEFPQISPVMRTGQFMRFEFDPVMGFRGSDFLEFYDKTGVSKKVDNELVEGKKLLTNNKFLIVTFGGSTTQLDNWPKYLIKYAKEQGVKEDIVVLNAGVAGYMSFNEKLYFSNWIMPMLERQNIKPNLILSLDGINDIWYRIFGYIEAKRENSMWYDQYHGYHQHLVSDLDKIQTITGASKQLFVNILNETRVIAQYTFPYTMRVLIYFIRRYQSNLTSSNINNIEPHKLESGKKEDVEDVEGFGEKTLSEEILSNEVEKKIVDSYKNSLIDFYGMAQVRNIKFVAYLQPVVLKKYYPFDMPKEYPFRNINYMGIKEFRTNRYFTRLVLNKIVRTEVMYAMSDDFYKKLNIQFPDSFKSFIELFKNISSPEQLYTRDSIHYNQLGKETIAKAIVGDLMKKGILTVK